MAGLFDLSGLMGGGGFDPSQLMDLFGPSAANAAPMVPGFDERFGAAFNPDAAPSPTNVPPGMITPTMNPPEMNPSPVAPGTVPLPRAFPGDPSTGQFPPGGGPDALRSVAGRPEMNPLVGAPLSLMPPGAPADVGAALAGPTPTQMPLGSGDAGLPPASGGTSDNTEVGARAKTEGEKRPSLAEALKGAQAPKGPEMQKISTPNAPRPTGTIRGGDLQALLMALNAGAPAMERRLPITLGGGR